MLKRNNRVINNRVIKWSWQLGITALILVAWEFMPPALGISELILPRFSAIVGWATEPSLAGAGSLSSNMIVTLREILIAFGIASAAGILVGTVIGTSRSANALLQPILTGLFAVPLITLIPMFLVTFGLGEPSKIAFGSLYAFFPVLFNTTAGVASVSQTHRQVGRAYGLSPFARFYKIIVPGASSEIIGGLQIGMSISIIAVVSAEVFGSTAGMGYLVQRSSQALNGPAVWFIILVTMLMAWALLIFIRLLSRLLLIRANIRSV